MGSFIKYLQEIPVKIGSLVNSSQRDIFINKTLKEIQTLKFSSKGRYGSFSFSFNDTLFVLFKKDEILGFINYSLDRTEQRVQIKNIENLSKMKGFSVICYQIILKEIAPEILTGELLSTENIKAHKNLLNYFRMFVFQNNDYDITDGIISNEEIDRIMKTNDRKIQILLRENFSNTLEFINSYGAILTEAEALEDYLKE